MKAHILVVEDDAEIREGVSIYLKNQRYTVLQAANGKEGLEMLAQQNISLAIVDVMMPVMDSITMVLKLWKSMISGAYAFGKIGGYRQDYRPQHGRGRLYYKALLFPWSFWPAWQATCAATNGFWAMAGGKQEQQGPAALLCRGLELLRRDGHCYAGRRTRETDAAGI